MRLFLSPIVFMLLAGVADCESLFSVQLQINSPYLASPSNVVSAMLELAGVSPRDTIYDLGCGDGRIVISAAKKYGARGVGIDIDRDRINESKRNARDAGVGSLVRFQQGD